MWFKKLHICQKVYFLSTFGFSILLLSLHHTLLLGHILLFGCWIFPIPSGCQTVWTQMTICWGLIWTKPICKGYQQTTKVAHSGQRVQNNFLIKQFFHLAKQILSQSLIVFAYRVFFLLFCPLLVFLSKSLFFSKTLPGIPLEYQPVWIQSRPNVFVVQTVCKGYLYIHTGKCIC